MAQTNVQAFSGDVEISGDIRLGAAEGVDDDNFKSIVTTSPLEVHSNAEDLDGLGVSLNLRSGFNDSESNIQMLSSRSNSTFQYISFATATQERMRIDSAGNVGIGTTNPGGLLQIYGDSSNYVKFNPTATNDTTIVDLSGFGATSFKPVYEHKHLGRSWYLGPVNDSNGTFALGFSGGAGYDPDVVAVFDTTGNIHGTLSGTATNADNVQVDRYDTGDTTMYLTMANNATAGKKRLYMDTNLIYDNTNNRLRLKQLMLGDQNVYGLGAVTGKYGTVQTIGTGKGSYEGYGINGQWVFMSNGASQCGIYNDTNDEWATKWTQNGATSLYYDNSSKFQTTSDGAHVSGKLYADHVQIDGYVYHNDNTDTYFGFNGTDHFRIVEGGGLRFQVDSNGRVGIGVEEPAQPLDVAGRIRADTMEIDSYIYHVGDPNTYIGFNGNDSFRIVENSSVALQINSSSNIDIQNYIRHAGNTTTYFGFSANNTFVARTNNVDRLIIDSSGRIRMPAQPAFWAYTGGGAIFSTKPMSISFSAELLDRGGHYNTSNGHFTAPVAGVYCFHGAVLHRSISDDGSLELTFYRNYVNLAQRAMGFTYISGYDQTNLRISTCVQMSANQYVSLGVHDLGSGTDVYYGEGLGNFSGFLIG